MRTGRAALAIVGLVATAACAVPAVYRSGEVMGAAEPDDKMVFVSLDSPDDASIPSCVAETVQRARPDLTLMPSREFRDALFPWLEASTAPHEVEGFGRLLARPAVRQRLAELHLRYVAIVSGTTNMGAFQGGIACGAGYGGGGCLGLAWAKRESRIATALWDTKGTGRAAFGAEVKGAWIIPVFILPIPLLAATETAACGAIAQQILDHLSGLPPAR